MGKLFKRIIMANSNEVSLCSKYNSGANKQTEFELIKDKEGQTKVDIKPVLQKMTKHALAVLPEDENYDTVQDFKDYLDYWLEYDINNTLYELLSDDLQHGLWSLASNEDLTKEEKTDEFIKLFNAFLTEYQNLPITKTQDGKYQVSLVSQSHIQGKDTNPQNETQNITKEKTSLMENEEKMGIITKAYEMLKSVFSLEKTETPAEEKPEEVQTEEKPAEPETPAEPEKPAEVETPEKTAEETVEQPAEKEQPAPEAVQEPVEKTEEPKADKPEEAPAEPEKPAETEIAKTSESVNVEEMIQKNKDLEAELEAIKKAQVEKEIAIEKMSFIQKAKDEYSMLVGTPEEIGAKLYSISKSNLEDGVKDFVMEQLKKVAKENKEMTQEVGSITKNAGDMTDEDIAYAKAEEIAKAKGISINKALREVK